MLRRLARLAGRGLAALLATGMLAAADGKAPRSRHIEIVATAEVGPHAARIVRRNGRQMLEFDATILSYVFSPDKSAGADRGVVVDMTGKVRVVHDVACGDKDLSLAAGDRIALKGRYVQKAGSVDRIELTHPTKAGGGGCGRPGEHPDGYLRKPPAATLTPAPRLAPRPAELIPDQPFVGTPRPSEKRHEEILRLKESGSDDAALLRKIRNENVRYSLTTSEILTLRAAGVSAAVIEAMLSSGRTTTPR